MGLKIIGLQRGHSNRGRLFVYTLLVTVECGFVLLTRVFYVLRFGNANTIHCEKSLYSINEN